MRYPQAPVLLLVGVDGGRGVEWILGLGGGGSREIWSLLRTAVFHLHRQFSITVPNVSHLHSATD